MAKTTRFLGTTLLIASIAGVALAGETHGPDAACPDPPPIDCTINCTPAQSPAGSAVVSATDEIIDVLVTCLVGSIL
jgi:hypothetical protein